MLFYKLMDQNVIMDALKLLALEEQKHQTGGKMRAIKNTMLMSGINAFNKCLNAVTPT